MVKYETIRFSPIEGAWLAGVTEASGCFRYAGKRQRPTFQFATIHLSVAQKVSKLFGGVTIYTRDSSYTDWSNRELYKLDIRSIHLPEIFLRDVVPYYSAARAAEISQWAGR